MAKLPGSTVPPALGDTDTLNKAFGDANYAAAGPLAAAGGDYLLAHVNGADQLDIAAEAAVAFNAVVESRGGLTLDTTTNIGRVGGLKAGRTYLIDASVKVKHTTGVYAQYKIYNVTAAATLVFWELRSPTLSDNNANSSSGVHVFTPTVDTEIEVRLDNGTANHDVGGTDRTRLSVIEIGAVQADVVGGLEFMDIIDVTVATDTVSFGASGDGAFQRALDGDVDEEYFCSFYMPGDHGGTTLAWVMQPNGVSTQQQCAIDYSGASAGKTTAANLQLADGFVARDARGTLTLFAETGRRRFYDSTSIVTAPGGGSGELHQSRNAGTWDDEVTNITSIVFAHTDGALDYILPGAQFILWRRTRSNLRADSAAVYERHAMETVDPGALVTTERTVGHSVYGGSLVGVSLRVEDAVTAGDITVNVKLDGVTALTAVLDTTNSTSRVVRAAIGVHKFAADKNISVEFVPTGYDNAGSVASPVTVQVHLTNDALINPPKNTQIEGVLWYPPETAHQWDDEFDGGVISPDWTIATAISATPIDPYAHVAAGGPRAELRNSWLRAQCYPANFLILTKSILPLPTNMFVWARFKYNTPHSVSPGIFDFISGIRLGVDFDNRINFWLVNTPSAGVVQAYLEVREGAAQVALFTTKDLFGSVMQPPEYEYLGVQKLGSVYHFWVAAAGGSWQWLGTHTYAGAAIEDVAVDMRSDVTAGGPGSPIQSCDFIRFVESATFLP